ncbi:MAG TPA: UDP-2,3-diacylglucosamine diphosphatase LpxI, partial [Candidatus Aminicenantes bacterium]|nr:UDP-2,3-diacylglucosamine diphosphatase LpxI [Candidatus Aminicenantes bacterium]
EAVMFGKIEHRLIFGETLGNGAIRALAAALPDHSPSTLLRALIEYLGAAGIAVCDPSRFLEPYGCPEGVLVPAAAPEAVETETAFGWPLVRTLADLDIGQTLVVKDRAVVAVEGMEGTDETVRRAAALAGPGVVVLKAARTRQDPRVDLPMVGLETVRTLVEARAAALVVEAGRVPFFQREEARAAAAAGGVALIGRR